MTRFEPFHGLRFHEIGAAKQSQPADLSALVAPPYDVISAAQRVVFEERSPTNSVRLDYPHAEDGPGAYAGARRTLDTWLADATLHRDRRPSFTVCRMTPPEGRCTTGVFGALGLEQPGTGDIHPHEETTAKDKADRLSLIRATGINTSPIWVLTTGSGLGEACAAAIGSRQPDAFAVDDEDVRHELWYVDEAASIDSIRAAVTAGPVVVADGHHRLETALAHMQECPAASSIMAFAVELHEDELEVRAIHRIVEVPKGTDLIAVANHWFDPTELIGDVRIAPPEGPVALTGPARAALLVPKTGAFDAAVELDAQRIRTVTDSIDGATVRYHHDPGVVAAAAEEKGTIGVLLRPPTVHQIREVADARTRMPPKSTFFWPKPRTGAVFREVLDTVETLG